MSNLKDKKIIVTGASGGIGNSIIEKFYKCEAKILASGTKIEKLEKLKSKFKDIKILKFDISNSDQVEEFVENATNELGGNLDCIVNKVMIGRVILIIRWDISVVLTNHFDFMIVTNYRKCSHTRPPFPHRVTVRLYNFFRYINYIIYNQL